MSTTADIIRKVRRIEIKARGLSNHIFAGEYHSAFKGRGMSFSEVRAYQYGDDVRSIDWNVTARTGQAHIKVYEEERELTLLLLVDISKSSQFGTIGKQKQELIAELCALLAFSALKNNDKVGLLLFSSEVELFITPKKGKSHILRIIRELLVFEPKHKGTSVQNALRSIHALIKKRCITFLISDFMSPNFEDELKVVSKKHDLIGIHIYDEKERQMPDIGLCKVADAETGETVWIDFSDPKVRMAYQESFLNQLLRINNQFTKNHSDLISLNTQDDYVMKFRQFFQKR